jgi:hypothetical protein
MKKYPKIPGPFLRSTEPGKRNQIIWGAWTVPELGYLADVPWIWTEKVDGINIRVHWDGYKVSFGSRVAGVDDPDPIVASLIPILEEMFPEELMEQTFKATEVTLYGEGYGTGIRSGGVYRPDQSFVLFDVLIGQWWLKRDSLLDIGQKLGIDVVPVMANCSITDAIRAISDGGGGPRSHWNADHVVEGWVGVTPTGLLTRAGERLMVKVKTRDFPASVQDGN